MIGVLLSNLGSPEGPTEKALRHYLAEFLWDRRVTDLPRWKWWLILHGIILRTRPARSAKLYQRIWSDEGSPLLITTREQAAGIDKALGKSLGVSYAIAVGMRYGNPSIESALDELMGKGCDRLLVLPLYPQFSSATTASTFDAVADVFRKRKHHPEIRFLSGYHDDPGYLDALAGSIRDYWDREGEPDRFLISFHGMPVRTKECGDPYFEQCLTTAKGLRDRLGMDEKSAFLAFQSQFGNEEWLSPKTDKTLQAWARENLGRVDVVCPGFSSDCLETLEEIAMTNREIYRKAGGGDYRFIPCLNASAAHIDALAAIVRKGLAGWLDR